MKRFSKILLGLSLMLMVAANAQAQLNPTLYHMKDLPINNELNPAFQPKNGSVYFSIPFIPFFAPTSIDASLTGENLTVGNWFIDPNYEAVAKGGGNYGMGGFSFDYSPISFGFMVKDMYFTMDVRLRAPIEGRITKDLERLFWYGNGAPETLGKPLSMDGLGASATVYGEVALGFSKEILKDQLTVGGKVKYLQGLIMGDVGLGSGSYIKTDASTYDITLGFNPEIYLSGVPVTVPGGVFTLDSLFDDSEFDLKNYKFESGSSGFAFDLGGTWDLPWVKGLNVSASVLNIGFINWKGNKIVAVDPSNTFTFSGFDMSESGKDFGEQLLDSIKFTAQVTSEYGSKRKWLNPTMYVGANYEIAKYFNVGALFGYQFAKYENLPMFALSANTQGLPVNVSASYSYYNGNNNIGFGVVFGRRIVQWYLMTDNLLAINYEKAQNVNFRMGMNVLIGRNKTQRRELASAGKVVLMPESNTAEPAGSVKLEEAADAAKVENNASQPQAASAKQQEISKDELLKKAMEEEAAEGDAVKKN